MRLHRFFCNFDKTKDKIFISNKEIIYQVRKVLRLKTGKKIILFNNKNQEVLVKILNFDNSLIMGEIIDAKSINCELQKEINLYISILKKENFELVCQKATEIGVRRIIPLICDYTVKLNLKMERLYRIIKEAAEQSGRGIIPELWDICSFNQAIKNIKSNGLNLFLDPSGKDFKDLKKIKSSFNMNVFVGPEGGWSGAELNLAQTMQFSIIKISPFILRAETAALIGVCLASNL